MRFSGVWAASVTPLRPDLSIDHRKFRDHVRWLLANGCDGVAVFGSTGEANSFSLRERMVALDVLSASGIPMDRIIAGAGACALSDAAEMCRHILIRQCAGVLITPPFYYKDVPDQGILAFFEHLIREVGSDALRLVLYHFPRLVQVGFSEELIAEMVTRWPVQVAAIKDSSGDLARMKRLAARHPDLAVLSGNEKYLKDLLQARGAGCLTASANLTSRLAARVFKTPTSALQAELTRHREALSTAPFVPGLKQLFMEQSGDLDWLNIRPPLAPLSEAAALAFRHAVEGAGTPPNFAD